MSDSTYKMEDRNFEEKKEKLKQFSESLPETINLPSVQGGKSLFLFEKKVSGDNINDVTQKITGALIEQNKNTTAIYREFNSIYNTFDALDKDYIQRILVNLEATKEANRKAVLSLEKNKELIDSQGKIVKVLKKHKEKLEKLNHLDRIDELYTDYTNFVIEQNKHLDNFLLDQIKIKENLSELTEFKAQHLLLSDQAKQEKINECDKLLLKINTVIKITFVSFITVFMVLILIIMGVL